jgi:hypothetical protein
MAPIKRALIVEFAQTPSAPLSERLHPLCTAAVHNGTLAVIHPASGEIAGYAPGVWRRWWFSPLGGEEPWTRGDSPDLAIPAPESRPTGSAARKNAE